MVTLEQLGLVFAAHDSTLWTQEAAGRLVEVVLRMFGGGRTGGQWKSGVGRCRTATHIIRVSQCESTKEPLLSVHTISCQTFGVTSAGSNASINALVLCLAPTLISTPPMKTLVPLFFGLCLFTSLPPSPALVLSLLAPPPPPSNTGAGYVHSLPLASHARQVVSTPALMHLTFERRQRAHAILERMLGCGARREEMAGSRPRRGDGGFALPGEMLRPAKMMRDV